MNVLYVDATGTRGIAEKFAACLNRYHPDHAARACVPASFFDRTPGKLPSHLYDVRDRAVLGDCIYWADVVHLIHQTSWRSIGRPDMIGKKPTVYQRFTLVDKGDWAKRIWQREDWKHMRFVVVAEGWRNSAWNDYAYTLMPAPFPIEDPEYQPLPIAERDRRVFFSAMNRNEGPPAPKAFDQTCKVLQGLKSAILYRKPFAESMRERARSWVSIDEVATPVIHFAAFESLALGVPCISRFDDLTLGAVKTATGAESLPLLNADLASLRVAADEALAVDADRMGQISGELRGWMERYMHPRDVMARYLAFYGEAA